MLSPSLTWLRWIWIFSDHLKSVFRVNKVILVLCEKGAQLHWWEHAEYMYVNKFVMLRKKKKKRNRKMHISHRYSSSPQLPKIFLERSEFIPLKDGSFRFVFFFISGICSLYSKFSVFLCVSEIAFFFYRNVLHIVLLQVHPSSSLIIRLLG